MWLITSWLIESYWPTTVTLGTCAHSHHTKFLPKNPRCCAKRTAKNKAHKRCSMFSGAATSNHSAISPQAKLKSLSLKVIIASFRRHARHLGERPPKHHRNKHFYFFYRTRMNILPFSQQVFSKTHSKKLPKVNTAHKWFTFLLNAFWGTFATMQKLQGSKSNVLSLKRLMLYFEDLWDAWHPLVPLYLDPAWSVALALPTPGRGGTQKGG